MKNPLYKYLVYMLLLVVLVIDACNPAKKVMKNKEQFDKVGEAWSKEHPCINDTVTSFIKGDTITQDGGTVTDTVYKKIAGDTIVQREIRTRTIYKTIHDTIAKYIRDTRAEKVLQNELNRKSDSLTYYIIASKEYKADRDSWKRTVRVIGFAILFLIIAVVGVKFFLRKII